ncbi:protein-export chaperone SecB [Gluconacetobacter takamatsuzukensis]|uniref:Protein-export chaperone SecB n=1 Tax=Gluconacetobacter takamatsuzukensis TaxID=1286190 RepID=A0A7W4PPZ5_9PROT|nr:protein-export chaperone SecB [Gluconacetobacter takamatsuzukensis]MBB2204084.1 protein-export chaperone SecB [Gluconacetobacter takamatsuzukensis]
MHDGDATATVAGAAEGVAAPHAEIVSQYVKSVRLAVPGAPAVHAAPKERPRLHLDLDVDARQVADGAPLFEVALVVRCQGRTPDEQVLFEAELAYAALVSLRAAGGMAAPSVLEPLLLVEVPALMFPAARNLLADLTRDAGFPPVWMQAVDFAALQRSRRAAA